MTIKVTLLLFLIIPSFAIAQSSFEETEVKDSSVAVVLHGTLLVPNSKSKVPVVLFIAGSGPTNRNGNGASFKTNCTKLLAEELTSNGVATLRFDKRGIGKSKIPNMKEEDVRFEDFVSDVQRWVQFLKKDKRFSKVIIAGHSEGSLIGILASQKESVTGFISLAGAGRSIDVVLKDQLNEQFKATPSMIPELLNKMMGEVEDGLSILKRNERLDSMPIYLFSIFRPSIQPYMSSWLQYDPAIEIAKIKVPVLIVQGDTDFQVSVLDAELLHKSNSKATLKVVKGMNYIFKDAPAGRVENMATYNKPELPLSKELVPVLLNFIRGLR